jgi:p-cumate 2,3-dioxygenase beta subunit
MALAETKPVAVGISRSEVEGFLYLEASILDDWDLDGWLELLCDDASYLVPPNEAPDADPDDTLFIIADDIHRIRSRVKRLKSPDAHAEYPPSRTRRLITNVRILESSDAELTATSNFSVHRFRRGGKGGVYVGRYIHRLVREADGFRIAERRVILDAEELGALGAVSFIL